MIPVQRVKGQPRMWQMSGEPPPLVWMIPTTTGLCAVGSTAPPPFLITSRPPPLLQAVSNWQLSCDPFLPLMRAADPVISQFPLPNVQWEVPSRPPALSFQPAAGVDLVPVFPPAYCAILPPHYRKAWLEKRVPEYKVYLNNTLALETAWIGPEEMGLFQRQEKPRLMTNQVAASISRPVAASRNFHTLLLTPRRISGCPVAIKRVRNNKRLAMAAALMAMESDVSQGPSASSAHPLHLLSLAPIKIPLLTPPNPGSRNSWEGLLSPVLPAQITAVTSLSTPSVTLLTGDWKDQTSLGKTLEVKKKPSCAGALVFSSGTAPQDKTEDEHFKVSVNIDSSPKDNRPVASTPVPGSPWCVVWTGDDRVFFFNPTIQLSVWDKPLDLQDRGDLNKIIEDPPHKRKKNSLQDGSNSLSAEDEDDEEDDDHISKSKRNKLEDPANAMDSSTDRQIEGSRASAEEPALPLELRVTHFREMLLERGVSAFSTWEKELHKIVFDPRYLLLGPEERKQIFDQFIKARINEEYKERKSKLQQAKEEFRKLLEESKVTSRSTFKEFSERYSREPRFKQVPKQKDKELLFFQFVNGLKKRDKENRMKLRKMR